ncbi:MAG TPA: hypothetical protein VGA08_01980 [Candidatus Saccharimonadales bacterium]
MKDSSKPLMITTGGEHMLPDERIKAEISDVDIGIIEFDQQSGGADYSRGAPNRSKLDDRLKRREASQLGKLASDYYDGQFADIISQ